MLFESIIFFRVFFSFFFWFFKIPQTVKKLIMTQPGNQNERPPLGFLATEINFHRPPGDGFNNRTWLFPLIQQVAKGSLLVQLVSKDEYPEDFIENFVKALEILIAKGCVSITTSCGFLAMARPE